MRFVPVVAMCLFAALATSAQASDRALSDFFGQWIGSGQAAEAGTATQNRDGEVVISKAGDGFKITWTTMRTQIDDQASSVVKASSLTFRGTAKPNVFHSTEAGDPLKGKAIAWSSIKGDTLKIQMFVVEADGAWTVQSYDRTLNGPSGMDVAFQRITNGEVARKAALKLTKAP